MPSKGESTPSEEPTLKDIEERLSRIAEQLKLQGEEATRGAWRTIAIFGSSIIMVAVAIYVEKLVTTPAGLTADLGFLLACGFGVMVYALHHYPKIKRKS